MKPLALASSLLRGYLVLSLVPVLVSTSRALADDCTRDRSISVEAQKYFEERQYFLSASLYAQLSAGGCNLVVRNESRFNLGLALFELGDRDLARKQFERHRVESTERVRADTAMAVLELQASSEVADRRLELWRSRHDPEDFRRLGSQTASLADSSYRPANYESYQRSIDQRIHQLAEYQPKRPWVAGVMSGFVPGAGQAYAGAYQSAAVAFVLNSLFLASTLELAKRDLPVTALASGLIFSVTYVGNLVNAVESARKYNQNYWAPLDRNLRRELFGELEPKALP